MIQVLKVTGCRKIIAVDINQSRLDLACQLGADVELRTDKCDVACEVLKHTDNRGADAAFEVVGITSTVKCAVDSVRKGGVLILVGNIMPTVEMLLQSVVTREINLYGSCACSGEYPACLNMIAGGNVNVDSLISAVAPLADGALWFKRLYEKEEGLMKVILKP